MFTAWDSVSEDVVLNSFKACGMSSALDGSEDHLLAENIAAALDAQYRAHAARDEAVDLIFDDESDGNDSEFSGFDSDNEWTAFIIILISKDCTEYVERLLVLLKKQQNEASL